MGFIPIGYVGSFQRTVAFFPFFMSGYMCSMKKIDIRKYLIDRKFAAIVLTILILSFWLIDRNFAGVLYCSMPYATIKSLLSRLLLYVLAPVVSIAFISVIPQHSINLRVIGIGQNTMFFYLYHAPLVILCRVVVAQCDLPTCLPFIIIYYISIVLVVLLLKKLRLFHYLINPFSYLYEKSISCWRC